MDFIDSEAEESEVKALFFLFDNYYYTHDFVINDIMCNYNVIVNEYVMNSLLARGGGGGRGRGERWQQGTRKKKGQKIEYCC